MKTSPQEQIKDVIRLTEVWENERKAYPGWYIAPYGIRQTLEMYSKTGMLLTCLQSMQVGDALRFAMNLCGVWSSANVGMAHMKSKSLQRYGADIIKRYGKGTTTMDGTMVLYWTSTVTAISGRRRF